MSDMPFTLVIPLRLGPAPERALARLAGVLAARGPGVGAVIADDTADPSLRAAAQAVADRHAARRIEVTETAAGPFSIGRLRDLGTEAAPDGWVLFHDIDFSAPAALYPRLCDFAARGRLAADPAGFACLPVWFLTRAGTAAYRAAPGRVWSALARGRPGPRGVLADRLTRGSSAILLRRARLLGLGGHDPAFDGHGAEDFDLLHRLSLAHPLAPRPPDYARDFGSRHVGPQGFRAHFARYAAEAEGEGLVLAHLWHPRRTEDARYYAARARNFARLEARLAADPDPFVQAAAREDRLS